MGYVVLSERRQILQTHPNHAVAIITLGIKLLINVFVMAIKESL